MLVKCQYTSSKRVNFMYKFSNTYIYGLVLGELSCNLDKK